MTEEVDIEVSYKPIGRQGRIAITLGLPGGTAYTDRFDVTSAKSRETFLKRLCKAHEEIARSDLEGKLDEIAEKIVRSVKPPDEESQADRLVEIASGALLFHTPGGHDSEGYAAIECEDHDEVWPVSSRPFKRWLARRYHDLHGKVPGSQALQDALNVVSGKAIYEGDEHEVHVRIAALNAAIYLDLGDEQWRVVEITKRTWRVLLGRDAPARFIRRSGMRSLPEPVTGGSILELRPLLNIADERSWVLLVACLLVYLRGRGPYPILIIDGEQGSAKSTLCRLVLWLVDPRKAGLRRPPRDERDLMIAAANSLVVGFDNLSGLPESLSDALCSLATGGGFSTRTLFTDDEEKIFDAMRPVVMNGIDNVASRSDILDRAVQLHLQAIPEEKRVPEADLMRKFDEIRARVLGALLDALVVALRNEDSVKLPTYPRMADFATWVTAAEPGLGWARGTFMAAYAGNRQEAHELGIEASPIGAAVLAFMKTRPVWEGSAGELRSGIESDHADEKTKTRRDWPKTPVAVAGALKRIAQNLRAIGLTVEFLPRTGRVRPIRMEWAAGHAQSRDGAASDGLGGGRDSQGADERHQEDGHGDPENAGCDAGDGRDDSAPPQSKDDGEREVEWIA